MDVLADFGRDLLFILGYGAVGLALVALGYVAIDRVTPGKLSKLIYVQRNVNAALLAASGLVAIGAIVTTAILTAADDLAEGLANSAGYGAVGVALLALSFLVVDRLTPGDLGEIVTGEARLHPAVLVNVAAHLTVGAVVAAAIS